MECWYHFVSVSRWDGTIYGEDVVWMERWGDVRVHYVVMKVYAVRYGYIVRMSVMVIHFTHVPTFSK